MWDPKNNASGKSGSKGEAEKEAVNKELAKAMNSEEIDESVVNASCITRK